MTAPRRRLRILALLQLLLLLPPIVSGSICISADGNERAELGFCACLVPGASATEAAFAALEADDCGACRDEAFCAMRGSRPADPQAPATASSLLVACLATTARTIADVHRFRPGEPPAQRLPILRC